MNYLMINISNSHQEFKGYKYFHYGVVFRKPLLLEENL